MTEPEHVWSCWCEEVSGGTAPFWPSSRLQRHFRAGGDRLAFGFMRYGASRPRASYQTAPRCAPRVSTRLTLAYSTLALSFRHVDWTACRYHSKWRHPRTPYGHCAGKKNGSVAREVRRRCARPHHGSQAQHPYGPYQKAERKVVLQRHGRSST